MASCTNERLKERNIFINLRKMNIYDGMLSRKEIEICCLRWSLDSSKKK